MYKRLIIFAFIPFMTACFDSELVFEDQYEPVVEAYLYVSKAVDDIYLTSMISFGDDSTGGESISNARIVLEGQSDSWVLLHDDSLPGRYYVEEVPDMVPGDSFLLEIELEGEFLSAVTLVPDVPPEVSMSSTVMYVPKVEDMMGMGNIEMPDPVELSWNNPEAKYYFLDIQNIESNPISVRPDPPDDRPEPPEGISFQMITEPTNGTYYEINPRELQYFGTHRIVFTSVNSEYVNLYNSLNQDSRELNEPYTNIENGLGIFTAFNSDTLYLEVIPVYQK